jgi:phospholipase/carboxylesterase
MEERAMAELDGPRWGPRAGGAARQLVVLCHGLGADGHDLIDLAPFWAAALPRAAFVAPHGPEPCAGAPVGRQWFAVGDRTPARMLAGVSAAAAVLDRFVAAELARLGLAADACALMGFSQGAMTALFAGLRRAVPPRGILAYSGALIGAETLAERTAYPPVLIVHGEADDVVPVERSRQAEAALRARGAEVESLYRPGLEHGLDDAGLSAGSLFLQRVFARD